MRDRLKIAAELANRLLADTASLEVVYVVATKVGLMLDQDDADEQWCAETGEC